MLSERINRHVQIARELGGIAYGVARTGAAPRPALRTARLAEPHAGARREARIHADQRAPVRLVGRCGDWSGDASASAFSASLRSGEQVRHRQFRAELVHLLQIVFER